MGSIPGRATALAMGAGLVIFFVFFVLGASAPSAQRQRGGEPLVDPRNPLVSAKVLACIFKASVDTKWQDGEPQPQVKTGGAAIAMTFDEIDAQGGTARVTGSGYRSADIVAQLSGWNLHFVDIRPAGSLTVTTVFGQEARDGKLKAVYTRTNYLPINVPGFPSDPEVSQHYGECEVMQPLK